MASKKRLIWTLEPHTRAKHEILRRYLEAWIPILGVSRFPTIAYVDGFAGPGVYEHGEDGSPVIALKAALAHRDRIKSQVRFLFIERDEERAAVLQTVVDQLAPPPQFKTRVAAGLTFEDGFRKHLLHPFRDAGRSLPPTFAFIDPFGWTGVPFALVREILAQSSCEVLVNFMYEEVNRFIEHRDQPENFDELFGTRAWRDVTGIAGTGPRRDFLHDLYLSQLRTAARYVRSFEMRNKNNATDYYLFFASNSRQGIRKMKEAMWKVDESGEFRYSDATNPSQTQLFDGMPNFNELRQAILRRFAGRVVSVDEIEEYVLAETPFRETHYKRHVLVPLERAGIVVPIGAIGRRAGSFPAELRLQFVATAT